MSNKIVLFGAGHMGSAIARGLLRARKSDLRIIDPNIRVLRKFESLGVQTDAACSELSPGDSLILAMPPQVFSEFSASTPCVHRHRGLVVSVMAGVRIITIQKILNVQNVVRSITNTPSEVFEGVTIYCRSPTVDDVLAKCNQNILESFGTAIEVDDESLIDPATALCGGGPAFVAYFANALQKFGMKSGLTRDVARAITIQILHGTSSLLEHTGKSSMELCREVMTPGGTTERGIQHFIDEGLNRMVLGALAKSSARSRELGFALAESFSQVEEIK